MQYLFEALLITDGIPIKYDRDTMHHKLLNYPQLSCPVLVHNAFSFHIVWNNNPTTATIKLSISVFSCLTCFTLQMNYIDTSVLLSSFKNVSKPLELP